MRYDRWKRIKSEEPPVPEPGSVWSKLLGIIASIEATGVIAITDMVELAEGFELGATAKEHDLARYFRACSKAWAIRHH
jgi:hypothetical protein